MLFFYRNTQAKWRILALLCIYTSFHIFNIYDTLLAFIPIKIQDIYFISRLYSLFRGTCGHVSMTSI